MAARALIPLLLALWGPPAQAGEGWPARTITRLDLGPDLGLQVGGKVLLEVETLPWSHGGLGVGALVAVHGIPWHQPGYVPEGLRYGGSDVVSRFAVTVGHVFRLADRRLGIGLHAFTGALVRTQGTTVDDPAHDVFLRQAHRLTTWEVGARIELPMRLSERAGFTIDATVPLYVHGQAGLPQSFLIDGPTIGLSLALYL